MTRGTSTRNETNGHQFVHRALLYRTDSDYLAITVLFVRAGLAGGEKVVGVVEPHRIAGLRSALGADAAKVDFRDIGEFDSPVRRIAAFHEVVQEHPGNLRAFGELPAAAWRGTRFEIAEWKRYEAIINVAFASAEARFMCTYDASALPGEIIDAAIRTHPETIACNGVEATAGFAEPTEFYAEQDGGPLPPPSNLTAGIRFSAGELASVRAFVAAEAVRFELPADRTGDFVLAVNEVTSNVVEHGSGSGVVRVWADDRELLCDVIDRDFPFEDRFLGYLPPPPLQTHGAGLWIARHLCDLVEIRSDSAGSIVRLHLSRIP